MNLNIHHTILTLVLCGAALISQAQIMVTNNLDSGPNSLRAAITQANSIAGPNLIHFDIGSGQVQINLQTPLPLITDPVTIDGTTQPGNVVGPKVWIKGSGLNIYNVSTYGANDAGLYFTPTANGSTVRGLSIFNFGHYGIVGHDNLTIEDNTIHSIFASPLINLSSGSAITLLGTGNTVTGNFLGSDHLRTPGQGCARAGILVESSHTTQNPPGTPNYLGLGSPGDANIILNNGIFNHPPYIAGGGGILVWNSTNVQISANIFHNNTNNSNNSDAIWLGAFAPSGIDGNNLHPKPIILGYNASTQIVFGTASPGDVVEVFRSDNSTFQNTSEYFGATTADAAGIWQLAGIVVDPVSCSTIVRATATDGLHNTSELANPVEIRCDQFSDPPPCTIPATASFTASTNCIGQTTQFVNTSGPSGQLIGASYSWDFGDPNSPNNTATSSNAAHLFVGNGSGGQETFVVTLTITIGNCSIVAQEEIIICETSGCCGTQLPVHGIADAPLEDIGQFALDANSGQLIFKRHDCPGRVVIDCFTGPSQLDGAEHVISASALTLSDDWREELGEYFNRNQAYPSTEPALTANANDFEQGFLNQWRMKSSYAYRAPINVDSEQWNYEKGTFPITFFNWRAPHLNDGNFWVKGTTALKYSPNGVPIEEENLLGVKSTSQRAFNNTLPLLVAQNAGDHEVSFQSFEQYLPQQFDQGFSFDPTQGESSLLYAHTGHQAVRLKTVNPSQAMAVGDIRMSARLMNEGLMIRSWVKVVPGKHEVTNELSAYLTNMSTVGTANWSNQGILFHKISNAGEWSLYEANLTPTQLAQVVTQNDILRVGLNLDFTNYSIGDVYIDDVRIQPLQSEMTCYVYDYAQRLTAVFDDQHFSTIYRYNAEGLLISEFKETVEGIKAISAQHHNVVGEKR